MRRKNRPGRDLEWAGALTAGRMGSDEGEVVDGSFVAPNEALILPIITGQRWEGGDRRERCMFDERFVQA